MALADITQRPGLLLGAAIVLHVVLISAQVNTGSGLPVLQVVTFGAFAELQRIVTGAVTGAQDLWTGYFDLRHVGEENAALKRELQAMQVRLQEERAMAQRTQDLRQLLELRQRAELETTAAEIIAAGASPEFRTVTIDKGSADRLVPLAAVQPLYQRLGDPKLRALRVYEGLFHEIYNEPERDRVIGDLLNWLAAVDH